VMRIYWRRPLTMELRNRFMWTWHTARQHRWRKEWKSARIFELPRTTLGNKKSDVEVVHGHRDGDSTCIAWGIRGVISLVHISIQWKQIFEV